MAFLTLERLVYLVWNFSLYQTRPLLSLFLAFFYGLRFDLAVICIMTSPILLLALIADLSGLSMKPTTRTWVRKTLLSLFFLVQLPTLLLNIFDTEFGNFLGRRLTFDAMFLAREASGKIVNTLLYYWPLVVTAAVIILAFAYSLRSLEKGLRNPEPLWSLWRVRGILAITAPVLLVIGARGGLQLKPLGFASAQKFVQPVMNNLVLNSGFTLWRSSGKETLPRDRFFEKRSEMIGFLQGGSPQKSLLEGHRPPVRQNIVVIILESFSLEFMGAVNNGHGYTPFLDELAKKGLFFEHNFANARRSIEGIGAIIGGIPALMNEPFISSQYQTNYFLGLGTLMAAQGYHTSFFHGAHNGSMYFDEFMRSAGVEHYFGFNEFPDKSQDDGTWGIFDEPFLTWMAHKLTEFPQPFFASVFSLTSHSPFRIPPQYKGKFPKGTSEIHETVGYTDYALRQFFREAEKQPWYKNTLFIITADHTFKNTNPAFNNEMGEYRTPLIFFHPTYPLPAVDQNQITEQVDILPSILDYIGAPSKEVNYLGKSIFKPGPRFAVTFTNNQYLAIMSNYYLQYRRGGEPHLFSMQDPGEKQELTKPADQKTLLFNHLKATIQYFSQGMWDNKLYFPRQ